MKALEDLLQTTYAAYNARDIVTTQCSLSPEVEWPDQLEDVIMRGPEAVADYWKRQWAVMDQHFEMKHFEMDVNGHGVATLIQTVRGLDGATISQGLVRHVYEFQNGLLRRMRILH